MLRVVRDGAIVYIMFPINFNHKYKNPPIKLTI